MGDTLWRGLSHLNPFSSFATHCARHMAFRILIVCLMASKHSGNCPRCAVMPEGLVCGMCAERITGIEDASRKRRASVRRAVRKAQPAFIDRSIQRLWLRCERGHTWISNAALGKEDMVDDPKCPICNLYFYKAMAIKATFDETVNCDEKCWYARELMCHCSCGGANHTTRVHVNPEDHPAEAS